MSNQGFDYVQSTTETSSTNHSDIANPGYDGILVLIDVTSVDTGDADETYNFKLQGKDELSEGYYDILDTGDVAGDGATLHVLEAHPALTSVANAGESAVLPDTLRVRMVAGGTSPSITYTIRVVLS